MSEPRDPSDHRQPGSERAVVERERLPDGRAILFYHWPDDADRPVHDVTVEGLESIADGTAGGDEGRHEARRDPIPPPATDV